MSPYSIHNFHVLNNNKKKCIGIQVNFFSRHFIAPLAEVAAKIFPFWLIMCLNQLVEIERIFHEISFTKKVKIIHENKKEAIEKHLNRSLLLDNLTC